MCLAPRDGVLWLDPDPATMPLEQVVRQMSALAAVAAELDGRLAVGESAGIDAIAALDHRLHAVLDGVEPGELARMRAHAERLAHVLEGLAHQLAALRELKRVVDAIPDSPGS